MNILGAQSRNSTGTPHSHWLPCRAGSSAKHRCRTRGEAILRPGGGEDGRCSHRRSALDTLDEHRAARGQTRAFHGPQLRASCSAALSVIGSVTSARTCVYLFSGVRASYEVIDGASHTSRCATCDQPPRGAVRRAIRRQRYTQNRALGMSRSEELVIIGNPPRCATSLTTERCTRLQHNS